MTKYANERFTIPYISKKYRENWARVFGKDEGDPSDDPDYQKWLAGCVSACSCCERCS